MFLADALDGGAQDAEVVDVVGISVESACESGGLVVVGLVGGVEDVVQVWVLAQEVAVECGCDGIAVGLEDRHGSLDGLDLVGGQGRHCGVIIGEWYSRDMGGRVLYMKCCMNRCPTYRPSAGHIVLIPASIGYHGRGKVGRDVLTAGKDACAMWPGSTSRLRDPPRLQTEHRVRRHQSSVGV